MSAAVDLFFHVEITPISGSPDGFSVEIILGKGWSSGPLLDAGYLL
jgi:hypothetical protein